MIILGIDPGTQTTGYGLIKKEGRNIKHIDNGVISPGAKLPLDQKLSHIFIGLEKIIDRYKPDEVAVEEVFMATNAKSALILGHARGVAMLAASRKGLKVCEYSTREIKKALVGYGNAEKNQVAMMVKTLLKLPEVAAPDASDALAAAICHAHSLVIIFPTGRT
jgi:crossover junction endodeoxyribonuclease RuvC